MTVDGDNEATHSEADEACHSTDGFRGSAAVQSVAVSNLTGSWTDHHQHGGQLQVHFDYQSQFAVASFHDPQKLDHRVLQPLDLSRKNK